MNSCIMRSDMRIYACVESRYCASCFPHSNTVVPQMGHALRTDLIRVAHDVQMQCLQNEATSIQKRPDGRLMIRRRDGCGAAAPARLHAHVRRAKALIHLLKACHACQTGESWVLARAFSSAGRASSSCSRGLLTSLVLDCWARNNLQFEHHKAQQLEDDCHHRHQVARGRVISAHGGKPTRNERDAQPRGGAARCSAIPGDVRRQRVVVQHRDVLGVSLHVVERRPHDLESRLEHRHAIGLGWQLLRKLRAELLLQSPPVRASAGGSNARAREGQTRAQRELPRVRFRGSTCA